MLVFIVDVEGALLDARMNLPVDISVIIQQLLAVSASTTIDYSSLIFTTDLSALMRQSFLGSFFLNLPVDINIFMALQTALQPIWVSLYPGLSPRG